MARGAAIAGLVLLLLIAAGGFAYYWFVWRKGEGKDCTPKTEDAVTNGVFTYNDNKECVLSNCDTGYTFTEGSNVCPAVSDNVSCTFSKTGCNEDCSEAIYTTEPEGTSITDCIESAPVCQVGDTCSATGSTCKMNGDNILTCDTSTATA